MTDETRLPAIQVRTRRGVVKQHLPLRVKATPTFTRSVVWQRAPEGLWSVAGLGEERMNEGPES